MPALRSLLVVLPCLWIAGCSNAPGDASASAGSAASASSTGSAVAANGAGSDDGAATAGANGNEAAGGNAASAEATQTLALSPENTKIQFVGTHVPGDPNPRTGVFGKFTGRAEVDSASKSLKSVAVEIETESLSTSIEKLDNHLRSEDFFDVREYPQARFESTRVVPVEGKPGEYTVTGNLTLLKETREITIPATISFDNSLSLKGKVTIDRTQFGMNRLTDRVHKDVEITVEIAEKK